MTPRLSVSPKGEEVIEIETVSALTVTPAASEQPYSVNRRPVIRYEVAAKPESQ